MGPGSFDPGNALQKAGNIRAAAPSMGPGSFDPGNSDKPERAYEIIDLQWGRGLSTPEMRTVDLPVPGWPCLQWGRGLSTPEIGERER